MDADCDVIEFDAGAGPIFDDPVAARTFAFLALMRDVDLTRDPKVKREGLEMLKRVRMSVSALSGAALASVK